MKKNHQTFLICKQSTQSKIKAEFNECPSCSFETKKHEKEVFTEQNFKSDVGKCSTTATNSTVSTDSGVNSSDDDVIPTPSSKISHLNSFETNTTASRCYKQFLKNNKCLNRDNHVNNNEGNNCENAIKNSKNYIINYYNEQDDENDNNISKTFDNKFKEEVRAKEGESTRYQHKINNFSQQRNLEELTPTETLTPTAKPISQKANQHNDESSLQHNEFNDPQQRPFSTMSSLSMSSTANSYDNCNLFSNMYPCKGSPAVSIRSISSTIIESDSDSDSDLNSDAENYVITKLGSHVTYPPNDPAISNINNSQTVLSQKVIANSNQKPLAPLEALATIGDRFGAAQALGTTPITSSVSQRPQIGSITLSNSNDVTFGDKHFYEGPVTIQQFIIDSRNKLKQTNGAKNPTLTNENDESSTNNAKDINSDAEKSYFYKYILKRKRLIISGVLAFTALLIVATIWGSKMLSESKTQDNVGGGYIFRMIPRDGWLAQPPVNPWVKLKLPVNRIIVIPTRTSECETQAACTYTVRFTQTYNIESQQQDDIIYNFLIGGDGNIYEGRGWDNRGSVVKGFNDDSISIAFIGSFKKQSPSYKQLNITQLLLKEGIGLKKLSTNYKIIGANKLDPTSVATSADALYKSFENWPHWSDK